MLEKLYLEKPNEENFKTSDILQKYISNISMYTPYINRLNEKDYLYWDKAKHKPKPDDLKIEEFWFLIKQLRKLTSKVTPIKSEEGNYFTCYRQNSLDKVLHNIDFYTGGQIFASYSTLSDLSKNKFIGRGVIEEAIASSQIEGANTTRKAAKKIILEKKKPQNKSEQMIINNYRTMSKISEEYKDLPLSLDLIYSIHADITYNDLKEDEQFRLRNDKDDITVNNGEFISHIPPKEKFVEKEIEKLIEYANYESSDDFIHPVVKAIYIHFWIGYLHPFVDGNGRLARALFYWYLLRHNYWTILYIPISTVIKRSRIEYDKSFVYSEQDDYDLTYFLNYNLSRIIIAINEFENYLDKIKHENKTVDETFSKELLLNNRQKQIIYYLSEDLKNNYITITSHSMNNSIGRITASKDIKELKNKKLIAGLKSGKFVKYYASEKLIKIVRSN